jgi:hypothetical protein
MALNLALLKNLTDRGDYFEAQCPACAKNDGDSAGAHLYVYKGNLAYKCVARGDDSGHSRRVFALAGLHSDYAPSPIECLAAFEKREREEEERELAKKYAAEWPSILKGYRWPLSAIIQDDNSGIPDEPSGSHWKSHLQLFSPDDLLWVGERYDSGDHVKPYSFATQRRIVKRAALPAQVPLTTSATFKPGATSRSDASVLEKKYLVVESDTLSRDDTGAIFNFLRQEAGLHLWMVVDTGGSSLHGHFSYPPTEALSDLKTRLTSWGCDPAMFGLSQPCRLAGVVRKETRRWQRIVYFNHAAGHGGQPQ